MSAALSPPPAAPSSHRIAASSPAELERALGVLAEGKGRWLAVAPSERLALLETLRASFAAVAERWVDACLEHEGIPPGHPQAGEEWLAGPYLILRNLRLLAESVASLAAGQAPAIPGPITRLPSGQIAAEVFPTSLYDRGFYPGVTAEVWMQPGVTPETLAATQAVDLLHPPTGGRLCLVLGAGNVSSIGPMDTLYKLFVENRVVLYKAHPVNDYLGPLFAEGFRCLIERGYLQIVYGDVAEGAYLTAHPEVDEIHITGSDKTVEAIVFGPGPEGAARKARREPRLAKPISSELGNVSPVIVLPGPWSRRDLAYQAENLASMLTNNAGFNCNAARVLVTPHGWSLRHDLLDALRARLASTPTRLAYYPGAAERWHRFVDSHPRAERFGEERFGHLPWALIPGVAADAADEICFATEAFTSVFAEVPLRAEGTVDYLERAVRFANERLWGTLNATLLVHPDTLADESVARAFEQALAELRYGTITINHWAAVGYGLVVTPWGGYPGADLYDIQSGTGFVHNTLMFSAIEKTIVRSPFRAFPKPPWFASHQSARALGRALTAFEQAPSPTKVPQIFALALGG